jgi:hypothetical protein
VDSKSNRALFSVFDTFPWTVAVVRQALGRHQRCEVRPRSKIHCGINNPGRFACLDEPIKGRIHFGSHSKKREILNA